MPSLLVLLARFALTRCSDRRGAFENLEGEIALLGANYHLIAGVQRPFEHHPGEIVIHPTLNGPTQRTGTELRIKALLGQQLDHLFGELDLDILSVQAPLGSVEQQPGYLSYLLLGERPKIAPLSA